MISVKNDGGVVIVDRASFAHGRDLLRFNATLARPGKSANHRCASDEDPEIRIEETSTDSVCGNESEGGSLSDPQKQAGTAGSCRKRETGEKKSLISDRAQCRTGLLLRNRLILLGPER